MFKKSDLLYRIGRVFNGYDSGIVEKVAPISSPIVSFSDIPVEGHRSIITFRNPLGEVCNELTLIQFGDDSPRLYYKEYQIGDNYP